MITYRCICAAWTSYHRTARRSARHALPGRHGWCWEHDFQVRVLLFHELQGKHRVLCQNSAHRQLGHLQAVDVNDLMPPRAVLSAVYTAQPDANPRKAAL